MFEVISNETLAPNLHRIVLRAPRIARARKPGQFVIVHADEGDERIPLTIGDADAGQGTITLFVQAVGYSTRKIVSVSRGGFFRDVAGPLGSPTHLGTWRTVACIGGGVGTAVLYPMVKALTASGASVTTIVGGRSAQFVILAKELGSISDKLLVTTEDGSQGRRGMVTDELKEMLDDPRRKPDAVFAVGPVPMMRAVAEMTRPYGIETIVSLNPIMIDGTGMCGGCRVLVGGEMKFACVDGPEFDGHQVDFDALADRLSTYREFESVRPQGGEECRIGRGAHSGG